MKRGGFMGILLAVIQGGLMIPAIIVFAIFCWIVWKCVDKYDRKQSKKRSAELERIIRRANDKGRE